MKRSSAVIMLVTVALGLASLAFSQEAPLRLEEAIRIALENNRQIRISERGVKKARDLVSEARNANRFQIQANATYTRFDRVATARFGPQPIRLGNLENRTARLVLTQPIDISGIIRTAVQLATLSYQIAELDYQRTRNEIILQVTIAYQAVARAEESVRVAEEALKNAQERLKVVQAQVDSGVAARFDLLRAQTQVAQNEQALLSARNQLDLARSALNNLLGRPLDTPFTVVKPDRLPEFHSDLESLIQQALAQCPEVLAAQRRVELAQTNIRNARRGEQPTLALTGQADFNLNTTPFNPRRESYTGILVLSVPIWDSGITQARVAQAREDYEIAQLQLQQVREGVVLEVRNAYLSLIDAKKRLEVARKGLEVATEALRLARVRFEAGVSPQLEISDAELAFTQAQTNLINAQYDYHNAYANLLKAIGTIGGNSQ